MAYGNFKDLPRRAAADKKLLERAINIAKNSKCDGYHKGLASLVYKFFNKNTLDGAVESKIMSNQQLAEELHKPAVREFEKRKVHLSFIDNVSGADLADILQLISKFNKGLRFLLCIIDNIYSKYAWVVPLKHKKGTTITIAFQNFFK